MIRLVAVVLMLSFVREGAAAALIWSNGSVGPDLRSGGYSIYRSTDARGLTVDEGSGGQARGNGESAYRFIPSLLTTCTELVNNFPGNAVNYFYLGKHERIYYFAYVLIVPPQRGSHIVRNEWYAPDGELICRREVQVETTLQENYLTLGEEGYLYCLFTNSISLKEMLEENGQSRLPLEEGLYDIRLYMDDQLVGVTFFRIIRQRAGPQQKVEEIRQFLHGPGTRSGK